jgi:hypothetical protein
MACFKPFKTTFIRERNKIMVTRNYIELNKITLARWVDKALDQALTRKNIILGFIITRIGHLRAMDHKTTLNSLYTL